MGTDTIVIAAIAAAGGLATAIDLRVRRVPNWLTGASAAAGITLTALHIPTITVGAALAGLVVGAVVMLPGHLFGATGAGDVKLLAAFGTLLGPKGAAVAFVYSLIAGGALAFMVALHRGLLNSLFVRVRTILGRT